MAMAGTMIPVFNLFAHPKQVIEVDEESLEYLDGKSAHILFAVAEAVVGSDFKDKAPNFISLIDDYLAYQRRESREALRQGLLLIETNLVALVFAGQLRSFSYLSILGRQKVLARLKDSRVQLFRNLYAAFVNISASAYYASEATWKEIQYDGVSVDHPTLLSIPRWRPGDTRPVEL
ncbi:MAG: hypothetical protein WKF84_15770 [Pyrinomonadaceae bacterium]